MSKRTFLLTAMISAFALTLLACGGVGKAEKDPFLASSVEKINAMFADMKGTNPVSQNMGMHLAFEERGLVLTINVMSDDEKIPFGTITNFDEDGKIDNITAKDFDDLTSQLDK